jgi:hypothetical protein
MTVLLASVISYIVGAASVRCKGTEESNKDIFTLPFLLKHIAFSK